MQQDARELVELAQRRRNPGDPIEVEIFDVLQLAGDAQQRYTKRRFASRIAIAATIAIRAASAASKAIALRSIEARKSLAGIAAVVPLQ